MNDAELVQRVEAGSHLPQRGAKTLLADAWKVADRGRAPLRDRGTEKRFCQGQCVSVQPGFRSGWSAPYRGGIAVTAPQIVSPDVAEKVDPFHQLHSVKPHVVGRDQLMERHQVGMKDLRNRAELTLEAANICRVAAAEELESDRLSALVVKGREDGSHAAFAEIINYLEAAITEDAPTLPHDVPPSRRTSDAIC